MVFKKDKRLPLTENVPNSMKFYLMVENGKNCGFGIYDNQIQSKGAGIIFDYQVAAKLFTNFDGLKSNSFVPTVGKVDDTEIYFSNIGQIMGFLEYYGQTVSGNNLERAILHNQREISRECVQIFRSMPSEEVLNAIPKVLDYQSEPTNHFICNTENNSKPFGIVVEGDAISSDRLSDILRRQYFSSGEKYIVTPILGEEGENSIENSNPHKINYIKPIIIEPSI